MGRLARDRGACDTRPVLIVRQGRLRCPGEDQGNLATRCFIRTVEREPVRRISRVARPAPVGGQTHPAALNRQVHPALPDALLFLQRIGSVEALDTDPRQSGHHQIPVKPLAVGLFVEAEIRGREVGDAVVLPRVALRGEGRVLVLDDESRLRFRDVEVLRVERERVVIGAGLEVGERVCVSPLPAAVDGMSVRVVDEPPGVARAGS